MGGRRDLKSVPYHLKESDPDLYNFLIDLVNSEADGVPGGVGTTGITTIGADGTGSVGTEANGWAPINHTHPVNTDTAVGLANSNSEGSGDALARAAHTHKRDVRVALAGSDIGTRNRINFVDSASIDFQVTDDSVSDEVDITAVVLAASQAHNLLSATHSDATVSAVTKGDLVVGNSTPAWDDLAVGHNGAALTADSAEGFGMRWGPIVSRPAQFTSNQNDLAIGFGINYFSTDAARDFTGFVAPTVDGIAVTIINNGSSNVVLKHQVTSTAANQIITPTGGDLTLAANDIAHLIYDLTAARWRAVDWS